MKGNFDRCLAEVLKHEGGYVNHPADPGGETNMGISKRSYPKEDIRNMTRARAAEIYRRDFWNPVRGDELPDGLDLVAFDAAVNSGVSRGAKWLQESLGVATDGRIGRESIAAAKAAEPAAVIERAVQIRLRFLRGLSTWGTFGRGWQRRVDSVRAVALSMAAPAPAPSAPSSIPVTDAAPASPAPANHASGTVVAVAGGVLAVIAYFISRMF